MKITYKIIGNYNDDARTNANHYHGALRCTILQDDFKSSEEIHSWLSPRTSVRGLLPDSSLAVISKVSEGFPWSLNRWNYNFSKNPVKSKLKLFIFV